MAQRKRATATVKMSYQDDTDLIAWWNSIPRGSRNAVMKDMMRDYIARNRGGFRPVMPKNQPTPFDPARFTQVCDDAAWIRSALIDLPGYLERLFSQAAIAPIPLTAPAHAPPITELTDHDRDRREAKLRNKQW